MIYLHVGWVQLLAQVTHTGNCYYGRSYNSAGMWLMNLNGIPHRVYTSFDMFRQERKSLLVSSWWLLRAHTKHHHYEIATRQIWETMVSASDTQNRWIAIPNYILTFVKKKLPCYKTYIDLISNLYTTLNIKPICYIRYRTYMLR